MRQVIDTNESTQTRNGGTLRSGREITHDPNNPYERAAREAACTHAMDREHVAGEFAE